MKAKRRYIQRRFHPSFGYYIGASIETRQTETTIKSNMPAAFGRLDLCSEETETAFPLVWNAEEAREFFNRRERFAFISTAGRAAFMDTEDYDRHSDQRPEFERVADAYDLIVKQKQRLYL